MGEGRKIKCEITTSLFSRWERHILGLWARPSPYLNIYVAGVTRELVAGGVAFLTRWENFTEKISTTLGCLSLLTHPTDPSVDFRVFSLNTVKMELTLSWIGVLEESSLPWLGIAAKIYWICVSNILLKLSWFCVAVVKLSILALMFSRSLSVAWIFLPTSSFILT
jgi:hypothetical protein